MRVGGRHKTETMVRIFDPTLYHILLKVYDAPTAARAPHDPWPAPTNVPTPRTYPVQDKTATCLTNERPPAEESDAASVQRAPVRGGSSHEQRDVNI